MESFSEVRLVELPVRQLPGEKFEAEHWVNQSLLLPSVKQKDVNSTAVRIQLLLGNNTLYPDIFSGKQVPVEKKTRAT
jgi:hypothetical protein